MSKKFQQVATLVCLDLDTLQDISKDESITVEELREHIDLIWHLKEAIIEDSDLLEKRFNVACIIFNLIGDNDE